jgi:hypothetical protein
MLELVNWDRRNAGLSPVELDEVATRAGQRHVEDMATHGYSAHWGSDGSVPEQRYTEAGGDQLVRENVTCFSDSKERKLEGNPIFLAEELVDGEGVYMAEKPPHDGHRQNILIPTHNRLGIGLAKAEGLKELCISQEFVDAYGDYDELPKSNRAGARITISGRVEAPAEFGAVGIAKGPLPDKLMASDLNSTSTYMMPTPYALYFPKGFVTPRPVAVENGRFTIDVALDRGAGRYAISVWGKVTPQAKGDGAGAPSRNDGNELAMLSLRTILVR